MRGSQSSMLDPAILMPAIGQSFVKLDPRVLIKNPVMFVVEIVAALTTVIFIRDLVTGGAPHLGFTVQIIVGAAIALAPGNLIKLLLNTQFLNGLISPILLTFILILANRKRELGISFESGRRLGQELAFTHGIDLGRGRGIGI